MPLSQIDTNFLAKGLNLPIAFKIFLNKDAIANFKDAVKDRFLKKNILTRSVPNKPNTLEFQTYL